MLQIAVVVLVFRPWAFSGVFGLFTMYLPPLFPTLLRTTGAGFCYNIGRIAAAFGTVFFGLFTRVGDFRTACSTPPFFSARDDRGPSLAGIAGQRRAGVATKEMPMDDSI